MGCFVKKENNQEIDTYPEIIRKRINFDGRPHNTPIYIYKLVKVYPRFALYQNQKFTSIYETMKKEELKNEQMVEIVSKGDFFESEFYDVWDDESGE